jgi:5-(carboxyamino)imidazole ribonucleotide mutase
MKKSSVAIIMGSDTDWPIMKAAADLLKEYGVSTSVDVVSAHRTPQLMLDFAASAEARGFKVIIAGAGGAAHLPGMVAAATRLPVIGVPVAVGKLRGLDALLSVAQMPRGVPVATMAVDNAHNAALMAVRILALNDKSLQSKLSAFSKTQVAKVKAASLKLKKLQ